MIKVFILAMSVSVFTAFMQAHARTPKSANEQSLLYWRYLCENQPQIEKLAARADDGVELKCLEQGWTVKSHGDAVLEVVDDAK